MKSGKSLNFTKFCSNFLLNSTKNFCINKFNICSEITGTIYSLLLLNGLMLSHDRNQITNLEIFNGKYRTTVLRAK